MFWACVQNCSGGPHWDDQMAILLALWYPHFGMRSRRSRSWRSVKGPTLDNSVSQGTYQTIVRPCWALQNGVQEHPYLCLHQTCRLQHCTNCGDQEWSDASGSSAEQKNYGGWTAINYGGFTSIVVKTALIVIIKICDLHIKLRTTTDLFSQVVNSNVWMTQKRNTGRFTSRVLNKTQTLSSTSAILFACGKPGVEHRGHVVQFFFKHVQSIMHYLYYFRKQRLNLNVWC